MTADLSKMRHVKPEHDMRNLPIAILLVIVFIAPVSTAIIYPSKFDALHILWTLLTVEVYERVSNVRALQYSNGVSPFALWTAYLLFDTQFIIVQGKTRNISNGESI